VEGTEEDFIISCKKGTPRIRKGSYAIPDENLRFGADFLV
jgi:hypothetical protein